MSQETLNSIKRSYEEAVDEDRDCLNAFINNLNNYYCI